MHPAVTNGSCDVDRVREDFPILAMKVRDKPPVCPDNAASARKPKAAFDRVGTAKYKGALVSFDLNGAHPHDFAMIIDRSGAAVRAGTHCAMPLLKRFGVPATCRASCALCNTREEVDCLARALTKTREFFP